MDNGRNKALSVKSRLKSFRDAGRGVASLVGTEPNARIHLAVAVLVALSGLVLKIDANDWRWLVLAIGWVWFAEAVNTSIEQLCDVVTREIHPGIRLAKDIAAAAVLIASGSAALVGLTVFLPYLF